MSEHEENIVRHVTRLRTFHCQTAFACERSHEYTVMQDYCGTFNARLLLRVKGLVRVQSCRTMAVL